MCNSAALEHELQRKLNRTWAALIVKRTSRPEALVEHFDRLPEKQVRQVGIDISEIWMVLPSRQQNRQSRDLGYRSSRERLSWVIANEMRFC